MRRVVAGGLLCLSLLGLPGCIAISAREVQSGMRYEAVAIGPGEIYVVDKECLTARRVKIVEHARCKDD